MPFDLIRLAMVEACGRFGSQDTFNAANFASVFSRMAGMKSQTLDGNLVRAMLCGRDDVTMLSGGAHFKVLGGEQ